MIFVFLASIKSPYFLLTASSWSNIWHFLAPPVNSSFEITNRSLWHAARQLWNQHRLLFVSLISLIRRNNPLFLSRSHHSHLFLAVLVGVWHVWAKHSTNQLNRHICHSITIKRWLRRNEKLSIRTVLRAIRGTGIRTSEGATLLANFFEERW